MSYPNGFLDQLRDRVGLAEVIGQSVRLVKKGREYSGLCPFHSEKTPSFTVNEQKGFYHCFGCGAHGDVISFVMAERGLRFPEAVEELAGSVGLDVPRAGPEQVAREKQAKSLLQVMELAAAFFERSLHMPEGAGARAYLARRGLDQGTRRHFRIGYAPDNRHALMAELKHHGVPVSDQSLAGLIIEPEDGDRAAYDRFRGRVMFPILNKRGEVIAFGGRILGEGKPKYLNSPETPLFHKGRELYGLCHARDAVHNGADLLVTEGYMDVIALQSGGFAGAVAPLGTAVSEEQIRQLWRYAPEPIMCFDGDAAGDRAAIRAAERAFPLLKPGKSLRFVRLPGGEDPDTLLQQQDGPRRFRGLLEAALPLSEIMWRLTVAGKPIDTPERKAAIEAHIRHRVAQIGDTTVRERYKRDYQNRLWRLFHPPRSKQVFWGKGTGPGPGANTAPGLKMRDKSVALKGIEHEQLKLLAALVHCPDIQDRVGERLGEMQFADAMLDNLRRRLLTHLIDDPGLDSVRLLDHLRKAGSDPGLVDKLTHPAMVRFVRADKGPACVLEVWESTYATLKRPEVEREWHNAALELSETPDADTWDNRSARVSDLARIRAQSLKLGDLES